MQAIRTMTKEGARLCLLASQISQMAIPTLPRIAQVHKIRYTINSMPSSDHYILGKPSFGPALVEAIDQMGRLQMSCHAVVNNGGKGDPSDEFVQAMTLLWRQPLRLGPALPNVRVAFPKISEENGCDTMDIFVDRLFCPDQSEKGVWH